VPGPSAPAPFVTAVLTGIGGLSLALGLALWRGGLPPGTALDVHVPGAESDAGIQRAVNARAGRDLAVLGAAFAGLVVALPRVAPGVGEAGAVLIPLALFADGAVTLTARAMQYAVRLAAARRRALPSAPPPAGAPPETPPGVALQAARNAGPTPAAPPGAPQAVPRSPAAPHA
jgi:hypothetical protein